MNIRIAGMVILYNAEEKNYYNIESYCEQVEKLYCISNGIQCNSLVNKVKQNSKIEYISWGAANKGISFAINYVANIAKNENYQYLVTFDQDSLPDKNMISTIRTFIEGYNKISDVDTLGIVAPITVSKNWDKNECDGRYSSEYVYTDCVIQSGAVHNIDILIKMRYDEKMFIDQVDFDYCHRLVLSKYKVVILKKAILEHNVYDKEYETELNKFSPYRYYYIVRNNLYIRHKFRNIDPKYCQTAKFNITEAIRKARLEPNKISNRAVKLAIFDYVFRRMGQCRWKL